MQKRARRFNFDAEGRARKHRVQLALFCLMLSPFISLYGFSFTRSSIGGSKPFTSGKVGITAVELAREVIYTTNFWGFSTSLLAVVISLLAFLPLTPTLPRKDAIGEAVRFGVLYWIVMNVGNFIAAFAAVKEAWPMVRRLV